MTRARKDTESRRPSVRCPSCRKKELSPATISHQSEIKHEGRLHSILISDLPVLKCGSCGEVLFTNDSDERIATALREKLGLYQPNEIVENRTRLKLTQRELTAHLGIAEETISRWENGLLIQSRAMNTLLRLYFRLPAVRTELNPKNPGGAIQLTADLRYTSDPAGFPCADSEYVLRLRLRCQHLSAWQPTAIFEAPEVTSLLEGVLEFYFVTQGAAFHPLGSILKSFGVLMHREVDDLRQMQIVHHTFEKTPTFRRLRRLQMLSENLVQMPEKTRDRFIRSILPLTHLSDLEKSQTPIS